MKKDLLEKIADNDIVQKIVADTEFVTMVNVPVCQDGTAKLATTANVQQTILL